MLPDCECKGRAFLHSLQEITEKKCEKISFAPILPLHSIAKSAAKPIFPPLPHPSFFAPKSPFFALFPVLNPISGTFSMARPRFLPREVHFFLVFPRFGADFRRFFEGSSSFFPCEAHFFSSFLILTLISEDFSLNISRFSLRLPHFQFMFPRPSPPSPTFVLIPPHFSISLPNKRTIARIHAHYARTRTPAHPHTSGGFRLLPSPLHPSSAIHCAPTR